MTSSIVTRTWIFICLSFVASITKGKSAYILIQIKWLKFSNHKLRRMFLAISFCLFHCLIILFFFCFVFFCFALDCFGYIIGNDFLFGTFSLDKNENQSILFINPNVGKIAAIDISLSYQGLRYEKQVILQNESLSLNDIMPMTSYRIISNQSIALQGVYGKFHSKYDILPILSLGSNYSLIYGMSFEFSAAVCSITANRNHTFISIKNPENRSITYLNSPNRTFNSTFLLNELENIQIYSQNLYNVSFMSTELLSVVCGSKNSVNNIRVHLPPLDRCVTSYDVSCFDKTTVPSGETHIRIIRLYPLLNDTINVFIDGVRDNKINQEKSIDYHFNVTADQPFCVRSHSRKWRNGNASFVDDNYYIISGHEIASKDCENISQVCLPSNSHEAIVSLAAKHYKIIYLINVFSILGQQFSFG